MGGRLRKVQYNSSMTCSSGKPDSAHRRSRPPAAETARARGVLDVVEAADAAAALDLVGDLAGAADAVLVKGSRAVGLDAVVQGLRGEDLA